MFPQNMGEVFKLLLGANFLVELLVIRNVVPVRTALARLK